MPPSAQHAFEPHFQLYALVGSTLADSGIDFNTYHPAITNRLTSLLEQYASYHYRMEPPKCGSCTEEGE